MQKTLYKKPAPKAYPLVSIIIVNYEHAEITCKCIESLNNISYPNFEILVVDNNSPTDNPQIIKKRFPNIIFIQNPINYGFAAGNNFGIMRARGKYVMLLNFDTEVEKGFLEPMVEKMEKNPDIGAVSPKIIFFHSPGIIQYAGYTPMNYLTMRNFGIGYNQADRGQFSGDRETAYAHGAAMMVPVKVIKEIGMMSYAFFLYYEEADWCERIKKAGYKIWFVHNAVVHHKESIATGKLSPTKIYYLNRNRILFIRRNLSGVLFLKSILYQILIAIPKNATKFLLKRKFGLLKAYLRAIGWNLKNAFNKEIHENPML